MPLRSARYYAKITPDIAATRALIGVDAMR